uniref:Pept_C1 domain-containing protein n=1 Tax=Parastrongyloides trichosuri TaxID=131310 RepID=A0A0N4Z5M4_PARTI
MDNLPGVAPHTIKYEKLYEETPIYPKKAPKYLIKVEETRDEKIARFAAYTLTFFVVLAVIICIPLLISIISSALQSCKLEFPSINEQALFNIQTESIGNNNKEGCDMPQEFFDEMNDRFADFVIDYGKCYENLEEVKYRQEIFEYNVKKIEKMNNQNKVSGKVLGVNFYADWSEEEFSETMVMKVHDYSSLKKSNDSFVKQLPADWVNERAANGEGPLPEYFDWREKGVVTPVRCQKKCGLCYGFASVATMEANYAIVSGNLRNFSEQEILDCNLENNGCNGGEPYLVYKFVHDHGMVTAEDYPYVAHRQNSCALNPKSERAYVQTAVYLHPDEDSMLDWLFYYGPITVNIAVPKSMKEYTSGVYSPNDYECEYEVLGLHSLTVVGYGTEVDGEKYWIVKNSWNGRWGEEGYVRFARGRNACGIEHEPIGIIMKKGMSK